MYCRFKTKDSSYCNYHNKPLDLKSSVECSVPYIEKSGDMLHSTEHVASLEQQIAKLEEEVNKLNDSNEANFFKWRDKNEKLVEALERLLFDMKSLSNHVLVDYPQGCIEKAQETLAEVE